MLTLNRCSTPVLPQWHLKDPIHSAKRAGGRLHLNTHNYTLDPVKSEWADYAAVQAYSVGNKLTRDLFAEPLWTDPDIKSGISVRKLGMNGRTFSQNPCKRGKKAPFLHGLL